ncbi:hypothetical protein AOC36_00700 [Erysipelothrix larvae]|uniref:histidine kinase n=1 Tax=Erysipelothrix larvae TaxID=1514105 RepID=A0A109UGE8_9FIRM|nr:HAMP domain-containing sensor histidine kinase [Erysipelothrix larvae]AMC92563.1 hypothetical protein AOC36_00700 [Erysipelothrix larvae]
MKISRRIFITLIGATFLVGIVSISYFVLLLPGLYTEAKEQEYLRSTETFHRSVTRNDFSINSPPNLGNLQAVTLRIPLSGYDVSVFSPSLYAQLEVNDATLKDMIDAFVDRTHHVEDNSDINIDDLFTDFDFSIFRQYFQDSGLTQLVNIHHVETNDFTVDEGAHTSQLITSDDIILFGSRIKSNGGTYSGYMAFSHDDNFLYFSVSSAATPDLSELTPIVLNSVPMIASLLIVIAILSSTVLSKYLAKPVEVLAHQVKHFDTEKTDQFSQPNRGDEFEILETALNRLSADLKQSMHVLSVQNKELKQAKSKQELFITNATHQLKTPLSSASLLIQGYLDGVGQYQDPHVTLPRVMLELKKMNELIHASLNIAPQTSDNSLQTINLKESIDSIITFYHPKIMDKNLLIHIDVPNGNIVTDPQYFIPSLENILSNAIKYTATNASVSITYSSTYLTIVSEGTFIDEAILPNISDPFVRSHTEKESGTGLGLYLVDTFLTYLNIPWTIENTEKGVAVKLKLGEHYDNN